LVTYDWLVLLVGSRLMLSDLPVSGATGSHDREESMSSKLTWHFQKRPASILEIVNETPARWVKLIDPPDTNPTPGKRVVGRHYVPDGEANALIMQGASGADSWFARCLPAFERAPYVHCWELPNEPPVREAEQRQKLEEFSLRAIELMRGRGLRTAALCLSVGWPNIGDAPDFIPILWATDYWCLHEYGPGDMRRDTEWYALRHRRTVAELTDAGYTEIPPLLITECGIDGPGGWKKFTNREGYWQQLQWYDEQLQEDSYVECATLFTSGPKRQWRYFEIDEMLTGWMQEHIVRLHEMLPEPEPEPEPEPIIDLAATIRKAAWNQAGVGFDAGARLAGAARELGLGAPVTDEFEHEGYRVQGFSNGVVYLSIDDAGEVEEVAW